MVHCCIVAYLLLLSQICRYVSRFFYLTKEIYVLQHELVSFHHCYALTKYRVLVLSIVVSLCYIFCISKVESATLTVH